MNATQTTGAGSPVCIGLAILLCLFGCDTQRPPYATFNWTDGDRNYACVIENEIVGGVELQSMTIRGAQHEFRRAPTGNFRSALFLESGEEELLVTQWTAGASTYEVAVYEVVRGEVKPVLGIVAASTAIGVIDLNHDGRQDIIVEERGGEGAIVPPMHYAYLTTNGTFRRVRWDLGTEISR